MFKYHLKSHFSQLIIVHTYRIELINEVIFSWVSLD